MILIPGLSGAPAENSCSYAHFGRTECDGNFEVMAHTHAESGKAIPRGNFCKQGEMHCWFFIHGRDAHKTRDRKFQIAAAFLNEGIRRAGQNAGFLAFLAGVDLDETDRPAPLAGHFRRQGTRELRTIHCFDHVEQGEDIAHLIGLQRADEMKSGLRKFLFQSWPLGRGFLHTVFAKESVARFQGQSHAFRGMNFADRHQVDLSAVSIRGLERRNDSRMDLPQIGGDIGLDVQVASHVWRHRDKFGPGIWSTDRNECP